MWISFLDLDPLLAEADSTTAAKRLDTLFDTCRDAGMNTVFFHARSHSDAYYPSAVFPARKCVAALLKTGFDPLAYAVRAAHTRGLALHAWINPYRIGEDKANAVCTDIFEQDGVWYYNPGADTARTAVLAGVREILHNYAVDGIHFDDYFYPAGLSAQAQPFESIPTGITVGDWRRTQVNALVSAVYGLTRTQKRVFGISPTALLHTDREKAYADTAMWLQSTGYVDYLCPQIYFGFDHETHPFDATLALWATLPRHSSTALYVGLALYKSGSADAYAGRGQAEWQTQTNILQRQVTALRQNGHIQGFVLFRYAHLATAADEMKALQAIL